MKNYQGALGTFKNCFHVSALTSQPLFVQSLEEKRD